MDRPLIAEFADNGFQWLDIICCAMHGDMRLVEWLCYHTICYSGISTSQMNAFLARIGSPITLSKVKGKLSKITFHQHAKAKWWFTDDRWQQLVAFCDGPLQPGDVSDTWAVWSKYAQLREIFTCMHPSEADQHRFKELTLDFFIAYRLRFSLPKDVSHYVHHLFAHAPDTMDHWKSIGAWQLQAFENLHAEHKRVVAKVSTDLHLIEGITSNTHLRRAVKLGTAKHCMGPSCNMKVGNTGTTYAR